MKSKIDFKALLAELNDDHSSIEKLYDKYQAINNKLAKINADEFDWAGLKCV